MQAKPRLLLCRLGFVLLCVVPTLLVCGWIFARPGQAVSTDRWVVDRAEWERGLGSYLGLKVEIDRVTQDGPEMATLEGVRLRDGETQALVAQAHTVVVARLAEGWLVGCTALVIEADQLRLLRQTLEQRVLKGERPTAGSAEQPVLALLPSDITLRGTGGQQTLPHVEGFLFVASDRSSLGLTWSPPASPRGQQAELVVARNRTARPPETEWQLDTAGEELSCLLLTDLLPAAGRMGREAQFAGALRGVDSPAGTSGELAGTFSGIDLDAIVTEHFPHQLSGLAELRIERAAIDGGKLVELRGTLSAQHGAMSGSLIAAAKEHLQLVPAEEEASATSATVPFQRLALDFELDERLLRLRASGLSVGGQAPGVVLAGASGPILSAPPGHGVPAVNLLRTLLPDNRFQVPATRQTDALVGLLPVPDLEPILTAAREASHTPTRLRSSGPAESAPVLRPPSQLR